MSAQPTENRVLIIDDDQWILTSTAMLLESRGFSVSTADSGPEGVEAARREHPAMILLDLMMPNMDGWEALEQLKADDSTREIPVVIFSARELDQCVALCRRQGAARFMKKPFEPAELIEVVREHLLTTAG